MNVQSVKNSVSVYETNKEKGNRRVKDENSPKNQPKVVTDSLTLSDEARKIQTVKAKVSSGFYEKPEVIRQVAKRINEEIKKD